MKPGLRMALEWLGRILGLAGIVFVGLRLAQYGKNVPFAALGGATWRVLAALVLAYASASVMLALAWRALLQQFGTPVTRRWSIATYGVTQLARYVPGNIMHLASRQSMAMADGLAARPLLASTAAELALIALAGADFAWLALPMIQPALPLWAGAALFLATVILVGGLLATLVGRPVARAFAWQTAFLGVSATLFVALVQTTATLPPVAAANGLVVGGAYVIAWLAGLLTPGAPAGLGVREFVLLSLLTPTLPEADLLLALLLGRCANVAGDCLFYGYAHLVNGKTHAR